MWEFYTPKIQILEFFPYTDEGWKEANRVEKRLIKFDLNNPLCLNENCGGCISLSCSSEGGKKVHEEKDEDGKSLHALNTLHKERDENGKSLAAVERGKKGAEKTHEKKDANGKSLHAVKMGKKGAEKTHEEKDADGKSVNAVKAGNKTHEAKDGNGKSLHNLNTVHKEKDANGKSVNAVKGAEKTNAQIWESTIDGFRSNAGAVARHNKARGWDPNARIRIS
jgi:hypothetical protein